MIELDLDTHIYTNPKKPTVVYKSVTTLLGDYKPHFDEDYHATRVGERRGLDKEIIIAEWRELNRIANEYGTNLHNIMERYTSSPKRLYSPRDDFEKQVIYAFKKCCEEEQLEILFNHNVLSECIMSLEFNEFNGIGGTSDIIEIIPGNKFNVWDYKTNKTFAFENDYDEYFYFPLNHLTYCSYNMYAMQISIYALMYERMTGLRFNRGGLFYWDKNMENFRLIPVSYMKNEVELLLQHYEINLN